MLIVLSHKGLLILSNITSCLLYLFIYSSLSCIISKIQVFKISKIYKNTCILDIMQF